MFLFHRITTPFPPPPKIWLRSSLWEYGDLVRAGGGGLVVLASDCTRDQQGCGEGAAAAGERCSDLLRDC